MKNSFLLTSKQRSLMGLAVALLLSLFSSQRAQAQCGDDNAFFFATGVTCNIGLQELTSCIFGGEYLLVSVTAGNTYTFETCNDFDFDTQITLYDDFGGGPYGYNDDFCGLSSQVVWTATFTGDLRVLVDAFFCVDEFTCMTLDASCVSVAPPNDDCFSATPIACGETVSGNTDSASPDGPGGCVGLGPNVWYTIVGTGGDITASLCVSSYDTQLAIFEGDCGSPTPVVCNDDFCGLSSQVTWASTAGTNYLIMVDGFFGGSGDYTLNVTCVPVAPANDDCANATPIACDGSDSGSTVMATPDGPGGCVGLGPNVWYTIVGTGGDITASLCGSSYDTQLAIFEGDCGSPTPVVCNDDFCGLSSEVTWTSTAGTNYLIMVDGFFGGSGDYTLSITCAPVGPANDLCDDAIPIVCGETVSGSTVMATNDGPATDCGGGSTAPDVWYTIVGTGGDITASLCGGGTDYDSQLDVYTGTCGALTNIGGCSDDFCGLQSQMTWASTAGTLYRIRVHGFAGATGNFSLFLDCVTTFPPDEGATVACPSLAVAPTPPTVIGSCGPITPTGPVITNTPDPLTCEGTRAFAYNYEDCEFGDIGTWTFTYTVEREPFTLPPDGAATVACPALAVAPALPVVLSNCGEVLTPTGFLIFNNPSPLVCEGTRTYQYAYQDCEGNTATWSFVYTVERNPFTVPANTAVTVACPALIVAPVPPVVLSNCGEVLTPTLLITNAPNPLTCEGTRTFAYTYTDCELNSLTWSHVVTVERLPFGVPANGGATVACPDQTDAQPTPPVVTSNCGEVIIPVVTSTAKPGCEGNRNYFFTYTDCEGNTATWTFIYTVEYLDFFVPASETMTVGCPLEALEPTPPTVLDNCGKLLTPIGPVVTSATNASGCEGSRKYAWAYADCEGTVHTWSKTYNFQYTADFFVYADGEDFVGCVLYVQPPFPPTIYDICGQEIAVTGPTVVDDISGCSGTRKYTFVYTDCGGHSHPWSFTFYANDTEPPVGNCPSGSLNNVNVTNLACIKDVPCPDTYDFSSIVQQLVAAGDIYDVCSGDDLVVELQGWTDLWECSDEDGDGIFTFGRTFYFSVADQCGNAMPLCGVTYSGPCQPIETFVQEDWGIPGDEPASESGSTLDTNDLLVIQHLLLSNPLVVGGGPRSLTLTNAQCVVNLLPGLGNPTVLGNCHQTNCSGCNPAGPAGMKNVLAANTIALALNIRFNNIYNGLTINNVRNQNLGCIEIHPNIVDCATENSTDCKLRVFDINGVEYVYPYTIGGLLDLANLYLGGNLALSPGFNLIYADALNKSIANVNAYWDNDTPVVTACDSDIVNPGTEQAKAVATGKPNLGKLGISLAPNPAGNEVTFKLAELAESQEVTFEIYNSLGQKLLRKEFGMVNYVNERIDLSSIGSGLYIVSVKAGGQRFEQKLVIGKG